MKGWKEERGRKEGRKEETKEGGLQEQALCVEVVSVLILTAFCCWKTRFF